MSSYNKIILLCLSILLLSSCTKQIKYSKQDYFNENIALNMAINFEFNKDYKRSAYLYEKLYIKFDNFEYLQKILNLNMYLKDYKKVQDISFSNINKFKTNEEFIMQNYVFASIQLKEYEKALKVSLSLVKINNSSNNYSFTADAYYGLKKYKLSSEYYESAYLKDNNTKSLLNLSNILYGKLNKKADAISYLETQILNHNCNKKVCGTLIKYYQEQQNIEGIISISNKMLKNYKLTFTNTKILKIKNYILSLYLSLDIKKAIKYLEFEKFDDKKLLAFYGLTNQNKKALRLARKLYKRTKDLSLLGQIAIFEYEINPSFSNLKHVFANFEKTLKYKSNAIYENYYGYILLNHNIKYKKALILIKKAYKSNPKNIAYKDSLAYAYYKNKKYKKAYKIMKEVINITGLKDEEIKQHWNKIKKYKDNK